MVRFEQFAPAAAHRLNGQTKRSRKILDSRKRYRPAAVDSFSWERRGEDTPFLGRYGVHHAARQADPTVLSERVFAEGSGLRQLGEPLGFSRHHGDGEQGGNDDSVRA